MTTDGTGMGAGDGETVEPTVEKKGMDSKKVTSALTQ